MRAFFIMLWAPALLAVAAPDAQAQKTPDGAWRTVQKLTESITDSAKTVAKGGKQDFFCRVDRQLQTAIDFEGFARGVMGQYASQTRRNALSAAKRRQLDRQIRVFTSVFRDRMVQAYGNAFLAVADVIRVETVQPRRASKGDTEVVTQKLHGLGDAPFTIYYQMKRRDRAWRLHNIAIEKINLGRLYRTQFERAAQQYAGDLDKVIENWGSENKTACTAPPADATK